MSLRARILLLFLGFSVLPLLLLGAGDYFQSVEALRAVLAARSDAVAEQTARDVEAAYARAEAALDGRSSAAAGTAPAGPFAYVLEQKAGEGTRSRAACEGGVVPIRITTARGVVEARLPVETLLEWAPALRTTLGKEGFVQVLDRASGEAVFDSRCLASGQEGATPYTDASVSEAARSVGAGVSGHASMEYDVDTDRLLSAVSAAGPAWAVAVSINSNEFIAPFRMARLYYLGFVLLVMALAAGAFFLLADGAFKSLRVVTAAADRIELGDLQPWLPPPGHDEVGRLSLAFRRMTERLEESVRQAELNQKLAAVGELATYLSHEIRNPLSSIRLSLQSLHRDVRSGFIPADSPRIIEIALEEVKRLDAVVRAVLEMGRPDGVTETGTCEVHATLEDTLDVLRPRMKAQRIDLEFSPKAAIDVVRGDPAGLRSVVINLAVNAIDAVDGRVDARIRISTWSGDGELHVRVADNGPGIHPGVVSSIFEPFFTTKARGNGIGLPTALRTVQPWGGSLTHEPVAAGSGAVFVIRLKLAEPHAAEPATDDTLMTAQAS